MADGNVEVLVVSELDVDRSGEALLVNIKKGDMGGGDDLGKTDRGGDY